VCLVWEAIHFSAGDFHGNSTLIRFKKWTYVVQQMTESIKAFLVYRMTPRLSLVFFFILFLPVKCIKLRCMPTYAHYPCSCLVKNMFGINISIFKTFLLIRKGRMRALQKSVVRNKVQ
jgi:hypothetical protein